MKEYCEECGQEIPSVENESRMLPPQTLHEELCDQFDLPRVNTTKDDLLTHISRRL